MERRKVCLQISLGVVFAILALLAVLYTSRADRAMSCIFCDIINTKTNTKILFEDENFILFKDIKPASSFHFLVIPKKHIPNVKALTTADKPMRELHLQIMQLK